MVFAVWWAGRGCFTSYILKRLELPVERRGEEPPRPKRSWTAWVAKPRSKQLAPRTQHWIPSLYMIYNETPTASVVTFSGIYIRPTHDSRGEETRHSYIQEEEEKSRDIQVLRVFKRIRSSEPKTRTNTSYVNSSQLYRQSILHRKLIIVFYNI